MKAHIRTIVPFITGMIYMIPAVNISVFDFSILNDILLGGLMLLPSYFIYYMGEYPNKDLLK